MLKNTRYAPCGRMFGLSLAPLMRRNRRSTTEVVYADSGIGARKPVTGFTRYSVMPGPVPSISMGP